MRENLLTSLFAFSSSAYDLKQSHSKVKRAGRREQLAQFSALRKLHLLGGKNVKGAVSRNLSKFKHWKPRRH